MEQHIKAIGILFLAFGLIGILTVFAIGSELGNNAVEDFFFLVLVVLVSITTIPLIIAGYGLFKLRRWSRIFGIIISCILLLFFPFGTALGGYALWVLTRERSKAIFNSEIVHTLNRKVQTNNTINKVAPLPKFETNNLAPNNSCLAWAV